MAWEQGDQGRMGKYASILAYARPHWPAFAALAVVTALYSMAAALQPWPTQILVDHVLGRAPVPGWLAAWTGPNPSARLLLILVTAGAVSIFILQSTLDTLTSWGWTLVGRRMVFTLAQDLMASLQRRSLIYHRTTPVGDTLMRITGDSWSSYKLVETSVFDPLQAVFGIAFMATLMVNANLRLTIVVLAAAPVVVAASMLGGRRLRSLAQRHRVVQGGMLAHFQQVLTGIPVVQAFGQEGREESRFQGFADASVQLQQQTALVSGLNTLAWGLIASLGAGLTLWMGAREVLAGRLTLGALLVFVAYLASVQRHVRTLASIYPELQLQSAIVARAHEALTTPPEVSDRAGALRLGRVSGRIAFEQVSFAYGEGQAALSEVSLQA
ncbi:MAG: transporter related, partial [Ramlibacter sp.]|nr:transporter related [Ramlibacter sp.]